jgi:hypothetical protein
VIDYLIAKATPQKGGVFLWQTDWDAIVRKLQSLEKENNSLRKMLQGTDIIRQGSMEK